MAAARAINDEQTEATVEVIHAYETLKETHNALVHQLQKLTVSMEELDWTLIEARKRKQVDACYPKQRRSDSATSNLRLEAKGSERASASKTCATAKIASSTHNSKKYGSISTLGTYIASHLSKSARKCCAVHQVKTVADLGQLIVHGSQKLSTCYLLGPSAGRIPRHAQRAQ